MASIFTKIIKGEIPCYKIAEDENFVAFLDINPLQEGHTLVIPKVEVDEYFELSDEILSKIMVFSKSIAEAIKDYTNCNRVGLSVIGLEVPHAHVHLIPINSMNDMNFANMKGNFTNDEFLRTAEEIAKRVRS